MKRADDALDDNTCCNNFQYEMNESSASGNHAMLLFLFNLERSDCGMVIPRIAVHVSGNITVIVQYW